MLLPPNPIPEAVLRSAATPVRTPTSRTIRAITGYGAASTAITGGAYCPITDFRKDFDDTNITALDFATVTSNLITLTKPGYYMVTYHTALQIALTQASGVVPDVTVGKTVLRAGGQDFSGTEGYVTMTEVPNLTNVVVTDGNPVDITVEGGESGFTVTDNLEALTAEQTELGDSPVKGSTSGTAMLTVKYNASNVLKLVIGGVEYDPTVGVFGTRDQGTTNVFALSTSISLIKLF